MAIKLDAHNQPVSARLNSSRVMTRDVDELIGICRGIVFDDVVTQKEAESLFSWLNAQPALVETWPANVLYSRLKDALEDDFLDQDEAADLLATINKVVTKPDRVETVDTSTGEVISETAATALPVTEPSEFSITGHCFVFTGKFASGTRSECQAEVKSRGGLCQDRPTKKTRFLIVGSIGSRDWAHSSWGRKIEKAVELRAAGEDIDILCEESWLKYMELL